MKPARAVAFALAAIGFSFAALFMLGEIVCRIAFPDEQIRYATDDRALYRVAPNQRGHQILANGRPTPTMTIDALGFRGPGLRDAPDGRILVLGDSFTFGAGVADDETFAARMDAAFAGRVQVVNGGQPGYGVYQMKEALSRVGDRVRPRRVVLVAWQGDFVRQPLPPEEHAQFVRRDRLMKRIKSSVFVTHVYRLVERVLLTRGLSQAVAQVGESNLPSDPAALIRVHLDGMRNDLPRIRAMNEEGRRWGTGLILVFWPREGFAGDAAPGLSQRLTEALAVFAERERIPFVSTREALAAHDRANLLIAGDGHPTAFAHCVVARLLLDTLRRLGESAAGSIDCPPPTAVQG